MTLAAGYKTSVNEPETITDAQAIDGAIGPSDRHFGVSGSFGGRLARVAAVARNIERS
jgi:hypothetical protein